jgi:hypothetical protein
MDCTKNYGLKKPTINDIVKIEDFNENADTIDEELALRALKSEIPDSLPANGGNAETLQGKSPKDFATAAQGAKADSSIQTTQMGANGGVARQDDFVKFRDRVSSQLADNANEIGVLTEDLNNTKDELLQSQFSPLNTAAEITPLGQNEDGVINIQEIRGRTLVDLNTSPPNTTKEGSYYKAIGSLSDYVDMFTTGNKLKNDTVYTAVCRIIKNTLNKSFYVNSDYSDECSFSEDYIIPMGSTGLFKYVLTSKSNASEKNMVLRTLIDTGATGELVYRICLYEGDYSSVDVDVIEGIQSTRNTEIACVTENLLDESSVVTSEGYGSVIWDGSKISADNSSDTSKRASGTLKFKFKKGSTYICKKFNEEIINGNGFCALRNDDLAYSIYFSNKFVWKYETGEHTFRIYTEYGQLEKTKTNVMLVEGLSVKKYTPYDKSSFLLDSMYPQEFSEEDKELRSMNDVADRMYNKEDGWYLERGIKKVIPDASTSYVFHLNLTGFKRVYLQLKTDGETGYEIAVKYDGMKLMHNGGVNNANESHYYAPSGRFYITISNEDSGWGDSFTPSNEEIKAYFLGWTMGTASKNLYTDGNTKYWYKLYCGEGTSETIPSGAIIVNGSGTTTLPTTLASNYTPYQLYYQLTEPQVYHLDKIPVLSSYKNGTMYMNNVGIDKTKITISKDWNVENDNTNTIEFVKMLSDIGINDIKLPKDGLDKVAKSLIINNLIFKPIDNINDIPSADYECFTINSIGQLRIRTNKSRLNSVDSMGFEDFLKNGAELRYKPKENHPFPQIIGQVPMNVSAERESMRESIEKHEEEIDNVHDILLLHNMELDRHSWQLADIANPNLLINGGFEVWQRGESFNPSSGYNYTCDRWLLSQGELNGAKVEKTTNGLKLSALKNGYAKLEQRGEKNNYLRKYFDSNSEVALSAKINGNIYSKTFNTSDTNTKTIFNPAKVIEINNFYLGLATKSESNYDYSVILNVSNLSSIEVEWVKLEISDHATLFVPHSYGAELALCQRYYEKSYNMNLPPASVSTLGFSNDMAIGAKSFAKKGNIVFKVNKRIPPTMKYHSPDTGKIGKAYDEHSGVDVDIARTNVGESQTNTFSNTGELTVNHTYRWHWTADSEIY